jgi:uncharacterized metal-binding protein YceD (DUF177 family)
MTDEVEFSRVVTLEDIGREGLRGNLEANADECTALTPRLGLLAISSVSAKLDIRKSKDGSVVTVTGRLAAKVTQECIVTLEPVEADVSAAVSERFVRQEEVEPEAVVEVEDEECYDEIIEGDSIDIGEMVSQCLTLELEPYPRKDGIEFELSESDLNPAGPTGPFAALADLKRKIS